MSGSAEVAPEKPLVVFKDLKWISVDEIQSNRLNPRDDQASKEVEDLKQSIREVGGVLVPIVVYKEGDHYVLLDGERRWRACKELAREDDKFSRIPANILDKPPTTSDNLMRMFNIHYKRMGWTTAALAEAIGKFEKVRGDEKLSSSQISEMTGVPIRQVDHARVFLRMPENIRKRCLSGELDEYHPILLGQNLQALWNIYPDVMDHYTWNNLVNTFIKKVDDGYVRNSRSFNDLGKMARMTIEKDQKKLFEQMFDKLVSDVAFTPSQAKAQVEVKVAPQAEESLHQFSTSYLNFLEYFVRKRTPINESSRSLLRKIVQRIESLLG